MQRIHFCSGTSFCTGDAIASALFDYAVAIARIRGFDLVELPTIRDDGSAGTMHLMLGPTSQISAESLPHVGRELLDPDLVDRLRSQTAAIVESPIALVSWAER